jgi:dienelactone hydrolase
VRHRATPGLNPVSPPNTPCALIAFSHGNSGLRQQSTFLTTHLASWGFVVIAPDHVGNTFSEMMALPDEEARRATHRRIRAQRPHDMQAVIRALLDDGHLSNELPPLDSNRLGLLGHSFGGWTALKVPALESRVAAVCGLAPASEPFVGRKAFEPGELPLPEKTISLVLAARNDVLVDLDTSIRPLSDRLGPHSSLEIIDRADHFHFCDGIEMLHKLHENNPREDQLHPTRPLTELRDEREMHTLLNERVTRFFSENL